MTALARMDPHRASGGQRPMPTNGRPLGMAAVDGQVRRTSGNFHVPSNNGAVGL